MKIELHLKLKQYYLELLTPETMKLCVITENKISTDKNGENVMRLEITMIINKIHKFYIHLFQISHFVVY